MLELAPGALIYFSKARGGRLFYLSNFSLKMTPSLFLFKTKLQHNYSKPLKKTTFCELKTFREMSGKPVKLWKDVKFILFNNVTFH